MKPIKNIRNNQEKPSLIKLSNEENDRPLLNIKNKNENSMILPATTNSSVMNNISKSNFKNSISIDNPSDGMKSFKDDRDEIDDFFFNTLPDISNTKVNQLTSKTKSQFQRPITTTATINTSNKNEKYDRLKREKLERDIDEMAKKNNDMKGNNNTINNNNNSSYNNNNKNVNDNDYHSELELDSNSKKTSNSSSTNKKRGNNGNDSLMEHYEEKEEWLLKNTDKLLRNLFDRQKKWEDTRSEIQHSIEKIKNDDNDSLENKALSEEEKQQRENKKKIELGLNKIKKLDEILEQKYKYERELKEKNASSTAFLSETEKQFLKKYDIEVPTTLLKDEVQKKLFSKENGEEDNYDNNDDDDNNNNKEEEEEEEKDPSNYNKISMDNNNKEISSSSKLRPILRREDGSTNLLMLDDQINFEDNHSSSPPDQNHDNSYEIGDEGEGVGESVGEGVDEEKYKEVEYFTPSKQNIIKKVADFSTENKKDKDRLKALFSNKTFLTETKSLPISLFISKPDIDDIDIDLDDDPELLQLKLEQENFKNDNISKKIFEKELEEQETKKESGKKNKNSKNGFKGNFIKRNIQLGGDARYYYALTDEEKLRLEAILQLPDEELDSTAMIDGHHDNKEGEGDGKKKKEKTKEGGEDDNHSESSMKPTEIFVDPDDYIKNDSKKTLKNGFLPSVEEFDNLKKINEKLHKLVPASEWLKRRTETDLFNTSLLSNSTNINSGFWSSQVNFDNNETSQVSLFSNNSTNSNKSNAQDSVYSVREKRETKKRMKTINEKLSELQQMRSNFESEYNLYEKHTEIPKFESVLDNLDMKAIEEQIQLANEKLLSMKLDPSDIERNSSFNLNLDNSESILDHIDIKKMESEIELDNQKLLKMRSNSNLDLGNIELFSTEDANAVTSISVPDKTEKEEGHDDHDDGDTKLPTVQSTESLITTGNINTNIIMDLTQKNSSNTNINVNNDKDNNNNNDNNDNGSNNNDGIEEK